MTDWCLDSWITAIFLERSGDLRVGGKGEINDALRCGKVIMSMSWNRPTLPEFI